MNPGRFYMPNYIGMRNIPVSNSMLGIANSSPRGIGLFNKITNGIRSVNWGGLLTNANKTLNVVNQAIPLVRQAGPMVNNMKSMFRIAKAFGSETTNNVGIKKSNVPQPNVINTNSDFITKKEEKDNSNAPSFFV